MDTSARLFLALCPPPAVREELAAQVAAWRWGADARCHAPSDWHLTLHFIGSVPRDRLDALRAGLAVPLSPFTLHFGQPALWPHGLAVLLPADAPPALMHLHDRLGQGLRGLGLRTETRPFRPHVTLARHAGAATPPPAPAAFDWPVCGYALMESTGEAARRYRVLQDFGVAA